MTDSQDITRVTATGRARGTQLAAIVALGVLVAGVATWTIHGFLPALAWGAILAIGVWPLYARAEAALGGPATAGPHGRTWLPLGFCAAVLVLLGLPLVLVGVQAAREAHDAVGLYHRYAETGVPVPARLTTMPLVGQAAADWWTANLAHPIDAPDLLGRVDRASAVQLGRRVGAELLHRATLFSFALVTLFVLLREGRGVVSDVVRASGNLFGERGPRVVTQAARAIRGTVDGLVLVGIAEGVLIGVGYLAAGVPHPTLLGLLTAVAAMVPFALLPLVAGVTAWLALTGSVAWAVGIGALALVVSFVADHLVRPQLIGGTTRLPFLWVLFGILGGVETFGLVGLFVGPAVMAVAVLLWREVVRGPATEVHASPRTTLLAAE